jgi:ATP-dependent exoDNAse (exonuclease V) alpha subunit
VWVKDLSPDQQTALEILRGEQNVFLTGAAGSGKSYVLGAYLRGLPPGIEIPVLASTGAAAILIGGRTFHSFFGLGIMEGGVDRTVERATLNRQVCRRIKKANAVVIDEISMISGPQLFAAEAIARKVRGSSAPWGGLRIIAVGDFAQLPPVNPFGTIKEWAFLEKVWNATEFHPIVLKQMMRATDSEYLSVLNDVRNGHVSREVRDFLNARTSARARGELTCLFPRRETVERYNLERLASLHHPSQSFETAYTGKAKDVETFRKHSPLADVITLKKDALVMLRQNDPSGAYANGSLGHIRSISDSALTIELMADDKVVRVEPTEFTLLNADGDPVVSARNFPVSLAWAMTIHKAQGATLDRVRVDLKRAWEPGQAYVALSRVRAPSGLFVDGWSPTSILADPMVARFHASLTN